MERRITILALGFVVIFGTAFGGKDLKNARTKDAMIDNGGTGANGKNYGLINGNEPLSVSAITWVAVDSMQNCFGPASINIKPLSFDPATSVLALIHRGHTSYAAGSGQLWYNISRNAGVTWRRVSELNAGTPALLRYPTANLFNATNSADTANVLFTWAAPRLDETATLFGRMSYGTDPLGAATPFAAADDGPGNPPDFGASFSIWGGPSNPNIYWVSRRGAPANEYWLWRTTNYVNVLTGTPPTWANANFTNAFSFIIGKSRGNTSYLSAIGTWSGDSTDVFNYGYSKSTDGGTTWTGWTRPQRNWLLATGLSYRYNLLNFYTGTGNFATFTMDYLVDANNRAHFFSVTVDSPWTIRSQRSISEVYETATGWAHKFITQSMNANTALIYPSPSGDLDQTHNSIQASISPDGNIMTTVWLDASSPTSADTMPDVWFSQRSINGTSWSAPVNLTQTPGFPEFLLHAAPVLKSNGGNSYTLFLGRSYQAGLSTYPPDNTLKTIFYVGNYTFTTTDVQEAEGVPKAFRLEQNYPNPFNPTTKISYSIPVRTDVKLSVYNVLGQEVATLVNELREAGTYDVEFSAAHLSSGMYFYTLKAGQFSDTKKLLVVK
jgi:hypothetical protein